ncbi:MAG: hypothetical protein K2Y56_05615 [Methylobacterium sp.]|nr:hypothetical protein [Methylobacterium sp.]MBX9931000.1 hypothetical protein [Methylobacterium sp.]
MPRIPRLAFTVRFGSAAVLAAGWVVWTATSITTVPPAHAEGTLTAPAG